MSPRPSPSVFIDFTDLSEISHHNLKTQWILFLHKITKTAINNEYPNYLTNIILLKDWESNVSASNSKIISGDLINSIIPEKLKNIKHKIIIKITQKQLIDCDNSLKVELLLYRNVLNKLLYKNVCPHIIGYINDKQVKLQNKYFNYLFLEMSDGVTLRNYSEGKNKMSLNDLIGITFQILYTLTVFNNILLSHNDLHPGNIIIENKYIEYSYKINKKIITLKCNYLVKVFDFDNASIYNENICRNIKLDYYNSFCKDYNMCNIFTNNDLYLVLISLVDIININNHKSLISVFDNFLINKEGGIKNFFKDFRLNNKNSHILKNLKSPYKCLEVLCGSSIIKDCINISDTGNYVYALNTIKTFNIYKPKLQIFSDMNENTQKLVRLCNNLYKDVRKVFFDDAHFLFKYYKYDINEGVKYLLLYCELKDIPMTKELAIKLALPFIYGIPNYIYNILESNEIQMYNNFAKRVNYLLPIDILNVFGNSGINYVDE